MTPVEALTVDTVYQFVLARVLLWAPRLGSAVIMFLAFWAVAALSHRALVAAGRRARIDTQLAALVARSARVTLLGLGTVTALGTLGIDVSALVAGLGLTGFALGFALRDVISNVLAGALLLVYRPFTVGDHIKVSGMEGRVSDIDLRYTTLEAEGTRILIPNASLFTNAITLSGR